MLLLRFFVRGICIPRVDIGPVKVTPEQCQRNESKRSNHVLHIGRKCPMPLRWLFWPFEFQLNFMGFGGSMYLKNVTGVLIEVSLSLSSSTLSSMTT